MSREHLFTWIGSALYIKMLEEIKNDPGKSAHKSTRAQLEEMLDSLVSNASLNCCTKSKRDRRNFLNIQEGLGEVKTKIKRGPLYGTVATVKYGTKTAPHRIEVLY